MFIKRVYFIILLILIFISCTDNIYPPLIITGEVTNIDKDGALFHMKITNVGTSTILDFGFVWDTIPNPLYTNAEKYSIHQTVKTGNYTEKISVNLIDKKQYYVRAFIRTELNITYGEEKIFISQGGKLPEIISISPLTGNLSDTIAIKGKYLSTRSIIVKIDNIESEIIKSNQDSILVKIPHTLVAESSAISVYNLNQIIVAKDSFVLIAPVITSLLGIDGKFGDEVTLIGKNFLKSPSSLHVYFGENSADFEIVDDQTIKAIVPDSLTITNCPLKVKMNNQFAISDAKFKIKPIEITDFNPKITTTGNKIIVTGKNFSPIPANNQVYIGGVKARTINVSENSLEVILSLQDSAIYDNRNAIVKVEVLGNAHTFAEKLLITDKWFRRANAPLELETEQTICPTCTRLYSFYSEHCFVIDKTAYVGLNEKNDFWAYNTELNTWRKLKDFPGLPRLYGCGFVSGNKIYFGTGFCSSNYSPTHADTTLKDWWVYDTSTDVWLPKKDFPVETSNRTGFSNNTGCFITNGYNYTKNDGSISYFLKALKYDIQNDSWQNEIVGSWEDYNYELINGWMPCLSSGDEVYVNVYLKSSYINADRMYIINSIDKTMKRIADYPLYLNLLVTSFSVNGNVYLRKKAIESYENNSFYFYEAARDKWTFSPIGIKYTVSNGIAFNVGNVGFVGLGKTNQLYEFDPNR